MRILVDADACPVKQIIVRLAKENRDYFSLKDEVKEVEQIKKNVDSILREEVQRPQPRRAHDMEL